MSLIASMPRTIADRGFAALLERFGPEAALEPMPLDAAERHCRELAASHYENFPVLSVAVPPRLRQDFANVYAYCRWADDLGDEVAGGEESLRLLDWWRGLLDDCYAGRASHPVFVALRQTIARHGIPSRPFEDLISAFRQDQTTTEYETFEELRDYCRRSADPVGRIVLHLCGRFDEANAALSDSVCTGLQLVNFWQDVARDADIGRTYLPREDRERFGYSDADLAARRTTPEFVALLRFEVDRARRLLEDGLPLADRMPGRLKAAIALFALGGLTICRRVERGGYGVWERRPKLTKGDKLRLLATAAGRTAVASLRRPR